MTARMIRAISALAALISLVTLVGCGGGGGGGSATATLINANLFVPNYILSLPTVSGTATPELYHWNHLPITVSFNLPSNWNTLYPPENGVPIYTTAANEWNLNPQGVTMISVVQPGMGQVTVDVVNLDTLKNSDRTRGLTSYTTDSSNQMLSASIQISLYNTPNDSSSGLIQATDVRTAIAHELGHALGIGGHSPNPSDLMYSTQTQGVERITDLLDYDTIMTPYCPKYFASSSSALTVLRSNGVSSNATVPVTVVGTVTSHVIE